LDASRGAPDRGHHGDDPGARARDRGAEARSLSPQLSAGDAAHARHGGATVAGSPRLAELAGVHPSGEYPVVVVGSGPGGLQTSYALSRLGVEHAVISQDDAPGGMFRKWPIYQRLLSWTKPDAPHERTTRAYEWYDHNSLIAEEPE